MGRRRRPLRHPHLGRVRRRRPRRPRHPPQPRPTEQLWPALARVRELLASRQLRTWSDLCWEVVELLDAAAEPPYRHVVADEVQDFGPAELRLLRALAPAGPDDVFLAGDAHQRIYQPRSGFARAGLEVRGRTTTLRLNYRTTDQIRRTAERILGHPTDPDARPATSLLAGPEPEIRCVNGVPDEIRVVAAWIQKLVSTGYRPGEIAIFARTGQLLRDRARPAVANAGHHAHELADHADPDPKHVAIGTMHRSKGLQYRAVAIIGVEAGELPLERVLDRQADEAARAAFLELERNLLYVACTRARERLLVTGVREMSRFLG
jgi:superfamily I DNA/RNA helicase